MADLDIVIEIAFGDCKKAISNRKFLFYNSACSKSEQQTVE